jgi:hypothetical protein
MRRSRWDESRGKKGDAPVQQVWAKTRRSSQRHGERGEGLKDLEGVMFFFLFFSCLNVFLCFFYYFSAYFLFSYVLLRTVEETKAGKRTKKWKGKGGGN